MKQKTIAILGRQNALGTAELESLFGAEHIKPFGVSAALLDIEPEAVPFDRIGGSTRIARILTTLPNNWNQIEKYLLETTPQHASMIDGKLSFGISVFGMKVSPRAVAKTALSVKKAIRASGASVRMVPITGTELNAATVLYNKLTSKNGWELLIVSNGSETILAQTVHIQDIDAYADRDQARPMRDAKVGMLPPKLAQIIINLATGETYTKPNLILDPFCGTGVVMQEATLMDYDVYGTDINSRMIEYTIGNLNWLDTRYPDVGDYRRIEIGDATEHKWDFSVPQQRKSIITIACETFLGQPLTTLPPNDQLRKIIYDANLINHRFLLNIASQIPRGTRLCVAVPAWRGKHEFLHLPVLDHLTDMGYTRVRFEYVPDQDLIYHRENQVVARELLVLIKN